MWSTNLWRSAITRKPMTDVYGCDYLSMAQVLTSHTVTHGVFTAPTLSGISMYSSRSRRPPCAETVSKWEFYFSGNTKRWSSDDESWAINAWNQIPLLSNWHKKKLFDFGFLFSIHTQQLYRTEVWCNDCIYTMICQIKRHANSCYTMMLFWRCCIAMMTLNVCVMLSG